jgi:beta-lactamase class A
MKLRVHWVHSVHWGALRCCALGALGAGALGAWCPDAYADTREALKAATAARLEQIARGVDGVLGYAVVDLKSGERFERLAHETFPAASTIKLAILYELFKQADERGLRLDETRPIEPRQIVGGDGILKDLSRPALTLRDLAVLMIVLSDNSATNAVIDAVGTEAVNARLQALGLTRTRLARRMMDLDAARRGEENVSSPADLAALLTALHRGEGLSPGSAKQALDILRKTPAVSYLRRQLPDGTLVMSKYGVLDGVRADAGIIETADRPVVFVGMGSWLADGAAAERAIAEAARAAYDYARRLATSGETGRRIRP